MQSNLGLVLESKGPFCLLNGLHMLLLVKEEKRLALNC